MSKSAKLARQAEQIKRGTPTGRQTLGYCRKHEAYDHETHSDGDHVQVYGKNGQRVTVQDTSAEVRPGTKSSIVRQMIAAGFLLAVIFLCVVPILIGQAK